MTKRLKRQFEINAGWTAVTAVHGWRHFRVSGRRHADHGLELELMAVCDRSVRFWVRPSDLEDETRWRSGWSET